MDQGKHWWGEAAPSTTSLCVRAGRRGVEEKGFYLHKGCIVRGAAVR